MEDLTLDICVLITGSNISNCYTNKTHGKDCRDLMKRMIGEDRYRLALDRRGKIKDQYTTKLNPQTYGHHFVKQMATMDKTVEIPWYPLNKGLRVALAQKGFTWNSEDYKFVIVASGTCCRRLVTHEPHFFNVQGLLRKIGIAVLWPNSA